MNTSLRAPAQLHYSQIVELNHRKSKIILLAQGSGPRMSTAGGDNCPTWSVRCRKWVYPPLTVWCVLKRLWSRLRQNNYASIRLIISGLGGGRGAAAGRGKVWVIMTTRAADTIKTLYYTGVNPR